jgi:hypothetical protein
MLSPGAPGKAVRRLCWKVPESPDNTQFPKDDKDQLVQNDAFSKQKGLVSNNNEIQKNVANPNNVHNK